MSAPAARAQVTNPRVSAFVGASLLGSQTTFVAGNQVVQTSYKNGGKFGFRGTADFNDHWSGEAMYAFSNNGLRVTNTGLAPRDFGVHVHQFTANALYFLTSRETALRPFGTVGLGLIRFTPTADAQASAARAFFTQPTIISGQNELALNVGVGAEAKIRSRYGVRVDLRDYISGNPSYGLPNAPASPGAPFFPTSGLLNRFEISGGIVLYLSGL